MSENPGGARSGGAADPFAMWRSVYQMSEETWSQFFEQMVGTQSFSKAMGQALENYLKAQETARRNVEASMSAMNVPTKSDLTHIAGQIVALDAKVDDLQFAIEELSDRVKALAENGPEDIRAELARLTATVEVLATKVAPQGSPVASDASSRPARSRGKAATPSEVSPE
jgi:polyhydroxyalkanoic acid synthase PhaR subunit